MRLNNPLTRPYRVLRAWIYSHHIVSWGELWTADREIYKRDLKRVPDGISLPPPPLLNPPLCEVCKERPSTLEIDYIDHSKEGEEQYQGVLGCTECIYSLKERYPYGLITPIEYAFPYPRQDPPREVQ